jgi:hypothetical protein
MNKERCLTFIKKNKELFDTSYPNWEEIYEEAKKNLVIDYMISLNFG